MSRPRHLPQPVRGVLWFTAFGVVAGAIYGYMATLSSGGSPLSLGGVLRGIVTGLLIAGPQSILGRFLRTPALAPLRRLPFLANLAVQSVSFLIIILCGLAAGAWLFASPSAAGAPNAFTRQDVLFSIAVTIAFAFVDNISHLLGSGVLLKFVSGRYYRPRVEQRIFLFIDMVGSTALAERVGDIAFHRLVNRFLIDVTEQIVAERGEIYRYVGDEVIATWKLADGVSNARCVRACFRAIDRLEALGPAYRREFGTVVGFRAGLHCGPVVTGEMGSVKKEIVFVGDTVNTAARIQEFCRRTGDRVLVSAKLANLFDLPPGISKRPLGDLHLRGKELDVVLYALEASPGQASTNQARAF